MSGPFQTVARRRPPPSLLALFLLLSSSIALHAQSPWERAALNLEATFTGPLARSLALVAIIIHLYRGDGAALAKSLGRIQRTAAAVLSSLASEDADAVPNDARRVA